MPAHGAPLGPLWRLKRRVRVVYFDHADAGREQRGFRWGEASRVEPQADGEWIARARVVVPPNSLHALYGHGVIDALNRLPIAFGPIAPGREAVLRPGALSEAARLLYEADRKTYGGSFEFVVDEDPERAVVYRIAIDNREYQRTLSRLQYLVVLAGREGHALRLRL